MKVVLANPRGFCAGVERAIAIVERALTLYGAPIYVRNEVVHNRHVVDELKAKGVVFVEDVAAVPDGATLIFSAHGVAKSVRREAADRGLTVLDATCPLVTKVHLEVGRLRKDGHEVVMIGHKGHPEVAGTMGQVNGGMHLVENVADVATLKLDAATAPISLAYVTQTTLSVDDAQEIINALRNRFPQIVGPKKDDICYATQNRQDAVKALVALCDLLLVVGSTNSSNSNRLTEVAAKRGLTAHLIDSAAAIDPDWLIGKRCVGVTAGASAPEVLVHEVIERLRSLGATEVVNASGIEEHITFALPRALVS